MKEDLYDDLYLEEKEEKTDFKAILFKYAIHWPWFVACTLLCIAGAWLYLRYTPPVYNISASVIIKDNDKNSKASSGMADLEDLGFYSSINNFDNEVEILQSRTLIKKVVEELDLYISYATKSSFHDIELYKSSPVKVWITPEEAQKLPAPARLHLTLQPGNKLNVKLRIGEEEYNKQFDKLPALLTTPSGTFSFTPKDSATVQSTQEIMATVSSPRSVANTYRGALSIEPTSKSTTIAQISVKSTHTQRGMDFINKLVEVYNRDANDDKNEVATKTAEFIDERIKCEADDRIPPSSVPSRAGHDSSLCKEGIKKFPPPLPDRLMAGRGRMSGDSILFRPLLSLRNPILCHMLASRCRACVPAALPSEPSILPLNPETGSVSALSC